MAAAPAIGQTRAAVSGTVTDASGAPVGNVTVTVRSRQTDDVRFAAVGPDGQFAVGGLLPGAYEVSVQDGPAPTEPILVELGPGDQKTIVLIVGAATPQPLAPLLRWPSRRHRRNRRMRRPRLSAPKVQTSFRRQTAGASSSRCGSAIRENSTASIPTCQGAAWIRTTRMCSKETCRSLAIRSS